MWVNHLMKSSKFNGVWDVSFLEILFYEAHKIKDVIFYTCGNYCLKHEQDECSN